MTSRSATADQTEYNPLAQNFTVFSLLRFAFPTIFMMLFFGFYTIVDTMFVSRFVNTNALSSINIVTPVINIIVGLGTMLAAGGSAIIARKLGDGRDAEGRQDLTAITLVGAGIGLVIACIGLLYIRPIVYGLGASDVLAPYAMDYLSILLVFAPANIVQVVFTVFFVTAGRPGLGMVAGVMGGVANAVLDYVFIVPMQMGIAGAALATGIGYMIPVVIGAAFFFSNRRGALHFAKPRFRLRVLTEGCFNGSSEMVSQMSAAVTTFFFNAAMMKLLGENGVAAITIIIYSQFLLTTLYIGFSMGVAPVVSYNYGSGDYPQLRRICRICLGVIAFFSIVVFAVVLFGGSSLVYVFTERGTAVYEIARQGFLIFQFSFLLCGFNIFASSLFTALSNGLISAIISFSRTFLFLLVGLLVLPTIFKVNGIWITIPLAELLTFVLSLVFLVKYKDRYRYL